MDIRHRLYYQTTLSSISHKPGLSSGTCLFPSNSLVLYACRHIKESVVDIASSASLAAGYFRPACILAWLKSLDRQRLDADISGIPQTSNCPTLVPEE